MKTPTPQEIHMAKYYYKFFTQIPERNWCRYFMHIGPTSCAFGHLIRNGDYGEKLDRLFISHLNRGIVTINDHSESDSSPKTAILNALEQIMGRE